MRLCLPPCPPVALMLPHSFVTFEPSRHAWQLESVNSRSLVCDVVTRDQALTLRVKLLVIWLLTVSSIACFFH